MLRKKDGPMFEIQGTSLAQSLMISAYHLQNCEAVFGLKLLLNRHYGEKYGRAIPDFAE
jgi:hypothetical protein